MEVLFVRGSKVYKVGVLLPCCLSIGRSNTSQSSKMKTSASQLLSLALLSGSASGHTIFQQLFVNGVDQGELTGIRAPDYDGVSVWLMLAPWSIMLELTSIRRSQLRT